MASSFRWPPISESGDAATSRAQHGCRGRIAAALYLAAASVGQAPAEPEPVPQPATAAPTAPTPEPEIPTGAVVINAVPWAEITEITDADGYVQELPEVRATPLYHELPAGTYKIHLQNPGGEDVWTCDLEVAVGAVATCAAEFGETRITDYFKETGWWR